MQLANRSTPVGRCETLGLHLQQALHAFPTHFGTGEAQSAKLFALEDSVHRATAALVTAQDTYRMAVLALVGARVDLKLVDLRADEVVRSVKRAADEAGRDVAALVFPSGITPIVKPLGTSELEALRALEGRILGAGRWENGAAQAARITAIRRAYETALAERKERMTVAADMRAARDSAKEDFLDVYAAVAGAIKELFPRDRRRQDAFFDDVRTSSPDDGASDGDDEPLDPALAN